MNARMDQEVSSSREVRGGVGEGRELDGRTVGEEKETESLNKAALLFMCICTKFSGDHCETRHCLPPGSIA